MKELLHQEKLAELEIQELRYIKLLSENKKEQRAINVANWELKYGVKIGDNVKYLDGSKYVVGLLCQYDYDGNKVNHAFVRRMKNDNTPGKQINTVWRHCWDTLKKI